MKFKVVEEYCKGCGYCINICPKKILRESNHLNSKGYVIPEILDLDECINCKKCELICPEMAITVEKEEVTT
ncbi:MAG: ferredoxin family protein [Promethearchaeota archaeon]